MSDDARIDSVNNDWLHSTAIAICGVRGSGKTALAYTILEQVDDRPVYVFDHPRKELVYQRGYLNMHRLEELYSIEDCVVWLDEPQITIPKLNARANESLQRLLSIARHRNITLVFSTCDTRWLTRALEAYIDVWFICDIEPRLVKVGSLIGKIIKDYVMCDPDEYKMEPGKYLAYARKFEHLDGEQSFELPEWWSEEYSKPYAIREKSAMKTMQMRTVKSA